MGLLDTIKNNSKEEVVDIAKMSNIELLKHIMDTYHDNYKKWILKIEQSIQLAEIFIKE